MSNSMGTTAGVKTEMEEEAWYDVRRINKATDVLDY